MRDEFKGKRIAFLGASNFQHGHFIHRLRVHFADRADKPYFYNRGLGGNTAEMAEALLPDEVLSLRPDYCFVQYGANDVGVWLYDDTVTATDEVLLERAERNRVHIAAMRKTVRLLKEAGITPILCSPVALNELIYEKEDIKTLADNREKGERIKPSLYTKKAFQAVNEAFRLYRAAMAEIASEEGIAYCDLLTAFLKEQHRDSTLYAEDGIHLSGSGHALLASTVLSVLGEEALRPLPEDTAELDALFELEARERRVQYVKWAFYHPIYGPVTEERIREEMEGMAANESEPPHRRLAAKEYLAEGGSPEGLRQRITALYH